MENNMTKKEIKDLAKQIMKEMDKRGLDMEIVLDEDQLERLADSIVDKLLGNYIRQQASWYSTSTMDEMYNKFKKKPVRSTEADLLGELAKLMTKLDYHTEREEFEVCAEIKKEIDDVNDKLSKL
jgi:uncharacterized protein YycO